MALPNHTMILNKFIYAKYVLIFLFFSFPCLIYLFIFLGRGEGVGGGCWCFTIERSILLMMAVNFIHWCGYEHMTKLLFHLPKSEYNWPPPSLCGWESIFFLSYLSFISVFINLIIMMDPVIMCSNQAANGERYWRSRKSFPLLKIKNWRTR